MSIKDITIIITSFRSEKAIRECLKFIDSECKVINVENSDNAVHKKNIEKEFKNVECILSGENIGYARGNNIGLRNTKTKYALILNPDAKLFPKTLKNFFLAAEKKPDFAIMGPSMVSNSSGNDNPDSLSDSIKSVDSIKGYAMFLNLSQFKEVGFFDENFFLYLEEIDLCRRVIRSGKKIYIDSNIQIFHEGAKSVDSSISFEVELTRNWHWMWSKFYFQKKYYGYLFSLIQVTPKFFSNIFKIILYSLLFNKKKSLVYFYRLRGIISSVLGQSSWYRPKIKT
tara:strand:+ start:942 stop:1793 length:852 start_codon:yes stop_codon:yes gene_type:complete